ncbi:MAG: four helix bundle protein [Acidobacteria bacterium]|nr:four helix bundle protein [Acidobacteriota bacterium]
MSQKKRIQTHNDLEVYQLSLDAAMKIFELTKLFPKEETYSLVDQIRRSSRSVCANLAEAWRKRRYQAAFISKLCECESESAETQVWIEFSSRCEYINREVVLELFETYSRIIRTLVGMATHSETWILTNTQQKK